MAFSLSRSLFSRMTSSSAGEEESSFSHVLNRDLYKHRDKIVDDESLREAEPFPLLSGESLEYIGGSHDDQLVALTNYRLFATEENGVCSIPLRLIDTLELQVSKDCFNIVCKDGRVCRLCFSSATKCRSVMERVSECRKRVTKDTKSLFAFVHGAYRKDERMDGGLGSRRNGEDTALLSLNNIPGTWQEEVLAIEYSRMGLSLGNSPTRAWRISQANDKYEVCPTYPKLLLVPALISDDELATAAQFRMSGRLPVVSWRHQGNGCVLARSSQPLVGVLGWRNPTDEKLLMAFSQACAMSGSSTTLLSGNGEALNGNGIMDEEEDSDDEGVPSFESESGVPKLSVFDLRSYTAALGNRAKGGGCECTDYYPNCEVVYKGLPNIHAVRKSFQQLRNLLNLEDQMNFLSSLESTQWMSYLSQLLGVACEVVGVVNSDHAPCPVLIHCSDGWDRTTQVMTLAELILDPYYRTIKGFRVLIEREWVGFGHRFSDRCGHMADDNNSRSPIFLQWLDTVHQLVHQFPCLFEFNHHFLLKLGQHCFSCLFGTFLCNSMKEREEERVAMETYPVWSLLNKDNPELVNFLYKSESKVLQPVTGLKHMQLWREMYCSSPLTPYQTQSDCSHDLSPSAMEKCSLAQSSCSSFNTVDSHIGSSLALNSPPCSADLPASCDFRSLSNSGHTITQSTENQALESDSVELESKELVLESDPVEFKSERLVSESKEVESESRQGVLESEPANNHVNGNPTQESENLERVSEPTVQCGEFHEDLHQTTTGGHSRLSTHGEETTAVANGHSEHHSELTPAKLVPNGLSPTSNGRLLQEAMDDLSPHVTTHPPNSKQCVLGKDGLPLLAPGVQTRLRVLVEEPQREVRRLRARLTELEQLVQHINTGGSLGERRESLEDQLSSALDDQSPASSSSWDCVDQTEGNGVRWVPDHAVSHCQRCGAEFWAGLRKHHCRSCGGVFCVSCSNFYCPVPHEQLFQDSRVCEKCYYKLDGHLKSINYKSPT